MSTIIRLLTGMQKNSDYALLRPFAKIGDGVNDLVCMMASLATAPEPRFWLTPILATAIHFFPSVGKFTLNIAEYGINGSSGFGTGTSGIQQVIGDTPLFGLTNDGVGLMVRKRKKQSVIA